MAISTREKEIQQILKFLSDEEVKTVTLVGQDGVGKTWTARQVMDQAKKSGLFEFVIWLTVGRNYNIGKMEEHIAYQMTLYNMCGDEKFLLIMDDTDQSVSTLMDNDTDQFVFSFIRDDQTVFPIKPKEKDGCKILITRTEASGVIRVSTAPDIILPMEPLSSSEEAWSFFREEVGKSVHLDSQDIHLLAAEVVSKCDGLPLALSVTGRALRGVGVNGSSELKKALETAIDISHGSHGKVYHIGYEMLPSDNTLKDCFLYSSLLFPAQTAIHAMELISCWITEGFINGSSDHLQDPYDEGRGMLEELINRGLLHKLYDDYVSVHVSIREMASYFDGRGHHNIIAKARLGLTEFLQEFLHYSVLSEENELKLCLGTLQRYWIHYRKLLINGSGSELSKEFSNGVVWQLDQHGLDELEFLAILNVGIKVLPSSLSALHQLRVLVLRGCDSLENVNYMEGLKNLMVLGLPGASTLKEIPDEFFSSLSGLKVLDLSGTHLERLPSSLCKLSKLCRLFLRDCIHLKTLPRLESLTDLKILDLSGASVLKEIQDDSFEHMQSLQLLDLSGTSIKLIPSLSKKSVLRQLLLKGCSRLTTLPLLGKLEKLEVLDLSGASLVKEILYDKLPSTVPKLQNLRKLLLSGCPSLETLLHLGELTRLEVLDLSGASKLKEITGDPFRTMDHLQVLDLSGTHVERLPSFGHMPCLKVVDLSGTPIEQLPSLDDLSGLHKLLLKGCSRLKTLPHLKSLKKLEELNVSGSSNLIEMLDKSFDSLDKLHTLDLSETLIEKLPSLSSLISLRKLSLKGCKHIETVPDLEALTKLEVLDLSGTKIKDFPHGILELGHLKFLDLRDMKQLRGVDWGKIKWLPEEFKWDEYNASDSEIPGDCGRPCMSVFNASSFLFLHESSKFWEKCFQRFHLSVCSREERAREKNIFQRNRCVFGDIYFQKRYFPHSMEYDRCLELRGVELFPSGIEGILNHADLVSLRDSSFIERLSKLRGENVKVMKECWIERCKNMDMVFSGEEVEENAALGKSLENLWISNLIKLRNVIKGEVQSGIFARLKHLHLEYCPGVIDVFSSALTLVGLLTLKIKFCDNLVNIFGESVERETYKKKSVEEHEFPNLHTLFLWELPELRSICSGTLKSLQNLKVGGCPNLQKLPLQKNDVNQKVVIRGELDWWNDLEWDDEDIKSEISFTAS